MASVTALSTAEILALDYQQKANIIAVPTGAEDNWFDAVDSNGITGAILGLLNGSQDITAGITASTTQTQGNGALTRAVNEVSTCANDNDTVTLPTAVAGKIVTVINNGAKILQIFPATDDTIDGGAADAAISIDPDVTITVRAVDGTAWHTWGIPAWDRIGLGNAFTSFTQDTGGISGLDVNQKAQIYIEDTSRARVVVSGDPSDFYLVDRGGSVDMRVAQIVLNTDELQILAVNDDTTTKYQMLEFSLDTGVADFVDGSVHVGGNELADNSRNISAVGATFAGSTKRSVEKDITASTTQTQGNGALTADINFVATVANANDTVTLPAAFAGKEVRIINEGANILRVFPAADDDLGNGVDTATTIAAGVARTYAAQDGTTWSLCQDSGALSTAQKEVFWPTANGNNGNYKVMTIATNGDNYITFEVPDDFGSIISAEMSGIVSAAVDAAGAGRDIDLYVSYATYGESSTTHTDDDTTTTYDFTGYSGEIRELFDITSLLGSLAAEDYVGLRIDHNAIGGAIDYLHLDFKYNRA